MRAVRESGAHGREDGVHPHETQDAHIEKRGNGGHKRLFKALQRARHHVIDAADEVGARDQQHFLAGVGDHRGIGRHQRGELRREQGREGAERGAERHGDQHRVQHGPAHPRGVARARVLRDVGYGGGGRRDRDLKDNVVQLVGDGDALCGRGAEGVDGGGDHHVGDRPERRLHPDGHADVEDLFGFRGGKAHAEQAKAGEFRPFEERAQYEQRGNEVGKDGGDPHRGDPVLEEQDQNDIEHDLQHAADDEEEHRAFGVAHGAQERGAEVVEQDKGRGDAVELEI